MTEKQLTKIFGWSCVVTYRPYGKAELTKREIHRRGNSPGVVTGAAKRMHGFIGYHDLTSYSRSEYEAMYGVGTETGRVYKC